jgi:hypothetical protein
MRNVKTEVMPVEQGQIISVQNNSENPVKYLQVSSHVRLLNGEYSDVSINTAAVIIMIMMTDMITKGNFIFIPPPNAVAILKVLLTSVTFRF